MQTISCPTCGEPLPAAARYCARCGEAAPSPDTTLLNPARSRRRAAATRASRQAALEDTETLVLDPAVTHKLFHKAARAKLLADPFYDLEEDDQDEEVIEQHATWQKIVEHKTPPSLPAIAPLRPGSEARGRLWPRLRAGHGSPHRFFWLSLVSLLALLLGGAFGVAISFGHNAQLPVVNQPILEAFPQTIALGGIVTLRGAHFTPGGQIELSRDQQLPLLDTGGMSSIQADAHGSFSDTVIVDPAWLAGKHSLYATNVRTHQQAVFHIMVTGQSALQGPPHLLLSSSVLDFGSGDEATNGSKLLALSNAGGGQVTWQASIKQPWLQISPSSGSIPSGSHMSAIVAVNRSTLTPGTYDASILFTSNTEQVTLAVDMKVTPLQPSHEAVLQLSQATLTFTGTAGGPAPQSQTIIVSNPGVQPLTWGASVSLQNGYGWLIVTTQTGVVYPGSQQEVTVSISIQGLPPGVYKGAILFSNQGAQAIQGSPQSIYVSLTVVPLCTLTFTPGNLSFSGTAGQAAPAPQSLHVGTASGCTTSQHWNAAVTTASGGKWLSINQASGSTPSQLQVSVNPAGLAPGTYTGTLTLTASTGQQIVPVTLSLNPVPCMISTPPTQTLQGTAGQSGPATQSAPLSTSGSCPHALNWTTAVSVITPNGGNWLSAAPAGTLTQPFIANVNFQANLAGLSANTYTGVITITAIDSTTHQLVGKAQISVTLTVLPQCTLQAPVASALTFTASAGADPTPPTQSFTISVTGNCSGNVTITPSVDAGGNGWLAVSPASASISSGGQATFTVTVTSSALVAGPYNSTISLAAVDGNGVIAGSSQSVTVSLTVQ